MSDIEECKEKSKESRTDVSAHVQTISLDKVIQATESRAITINVYPNIAPKSDKPVQTDTSSAELESEEELQTNKSKRPGNLSSESREIGCFEYTPGPYKNTSAFASHESKFHKFMNSRKFPDNKSPNRTANDLERKKLEAELKATEEIAKIQQTVIEKRLALELASLQEANLYHQKTACAQSSMPHPDLQAIEEIISRKQSFISQDVEPAEHQIRTLPPRPPPPTRPPLPDGGRTCNVKTDSSFLSQTSSDVNPLRHLVEKKILLDRRSSKTSVLKYSPLLTNSNSHEYRRSSSPDPRRFRTNAKNPIYQPSAQPGRSPSPGSRGKVRAMWKSAVAKIRRKMKPGSKTPEYRERWR